MNPITRSTYRDIDSLSSRLHERARRQRSRAMAALFARLLERLSAFRLSQAPVARWG
jgi:hypothetical protein